MAESPVRLAAAYLLLSGRRALAPEPAVVADQRRFVDDLTDEERIVLRHAIDAELTRRGALPDPLTMARS